MMRWIGCLVALSGLLGGCTPSDSDATSARPTAGANENLSSPSAQELAAELSEAQRLARIGQTDAALARVEKLLSLHPSHPEGLVLVSTLYASQRQFGLAAESLLAAANQLPETYQTAMLKQAGAWQMQAADFAGLERTLRRLIAIEPNQADSRRALAKLLNEQGRRFEGNQQTSHVARLTDLNRLELLSLIDSTEPFADGQFAAAAFRSGSVDAERFGLAEARQSLATKHAAQAVTRIDKVAQALPDDPSVAALRGRIYAETGAIDRLPKWLSERPTEVAEEPEFWTAIGIWLRHRQLHPEAIRAFAESLRRDQTGRQPLRLLIASLDAVGAHAALAKPQQRLADLDFLYREAAVADPATQEQLALRLERLGRPWEALSWRINAAREQGTLAIQQADFALHRSQLKQTTASRGEEIDLNDWLGLRIEDWPFPNLAELEAETEVEPIKPRDSGTRLELVDIAAEVGLEFDYDSGRSLGDRDHFLYQINGAGVAALDYDLDGCCDVYAMQSGGLPNNSPAPSSNRLFRSLVGQPHPDRQGSDVRFKAVTSFARAEDYGFGQGVCVADINQDGFPDLLLANVGPNQLLINQGDGTFQKAVFADGDSNWTSGFVAGDLDGDRLPEVVEINYIDDPKAYQQVCDIESDTCGPGDFRSAADRIFHVTRDGTFINQNVIQERDRSYGFTAVIANFDQVAGNDLFIANDVETNHFWVSKAMEPTALGSLLPSFTLTEQAGLRGCAIGEKGLSQACMGVATADFDNNGMLDLHITNFHADSANLFLQSRSGLFSDQVTRFGLRDASFHTLGFGTQAVDFDNDGFDDLAVLTGHVYDARKRGVPYQMLPQLFRGGTKTFTEIQPPASASDEMKSYWQREQLGRSLAKCDWNADGRGDLLATHLDHPLALLENRTEAGHWLQIRLVGVLSERDAIGATVTATIDGSEPTAFRISGGGYMSADEPLLCFGLGNAIRVEKLTIAWPSGAIQMMDDLVANRRYLIVEDQPQATLMLTPFDSSSQN